MSVFFPKNGQRQKSHPWPREADLYGPDKQQYHDSMERSPEAGVLNTHMAHTNVCQGSAEMLAQVVVSQTTPGPTTHSLNRGGSPSCGTFHSARPWGTRSNWQQLRHVGGAWD